MHRSPWTARNARTPRTNRAARTARPSIRALVRHAQTSQTAPSAQNAASEPPARVPEEYPWRTEWDMHRNDIRRPRAALPETLAGLPEQALRYLAESALADCLDTLGLPPYERVIVEMRDAGATFREIAAWTGTKKWEVERAMRNIRRAYVAARHRSADSGASGWQDVYLSETRRPESREAVPAATRRAGKWYALV